MKHLCLLIATASRFVLSISALILTSIAIEMCSSAYSAEAMIPVGVAKIDVTPEYPIRLHGYYARKSVSTGIDLRIRAKAVAFGGDRDRPAVLVTVDCLGVPAATTKTVAERIHQRFGVDTKNITICASHTHSAPKIAGVADNIFGVDLPPDEQAAIDRFSRELTDGLERVAANALENRAPAALSWGRGAAGFAANRRTPGGPVDHDLPILKIAAPDGSLRGVVFGYACHCTTIDPAVNRISGDWAGFAQADIEADHPGAVALCVIGCGGDQNPAPRGRAGDVERHGRAIADEVDRLLRGRLKPLGSRPEVALKHVELPLEQPTRDELEKTAKKPGPEGRNAAIHLSGLARGRPIQSSIDYIIQSWYFGDDLAIVFLAGEVVVDYALKFQTMFDRERLWTVAYANDAPCYIPSERILREGGYEGGGAMIYYAKPAKFRPGLEERIGATVKSLVPSSFYAKTQLNSNIKNKLIEVVEAERKGEAIVDRSPAGPLDPERALASFSLPGDLAIELVAAEPLVVDPVAIDFAPDGKLWVCEMRDYPEGLTGRYDPGGVMKYLEDSNGDGRYDRATVFLDKIPFPTGVMAWRKGVLICSAPEIFYAEDRDGDGKAEIKQTLFGGFATENYQARVNGLEYGLDNWIYGANGLIGGRIRSTRNGATIDIGGRDFRIKPDTGAIEPAAGLSQQGRIRNDWGDMFGNNNSVLLQQYPFPDRGRAANPYVTSPNPIVNVSSYENWSVLFPAPIRRERFNDPSSRNRVTSACGPAIYRDAIAGERYTNCAYICEPVHNLVRREVLVKNGVVFEGRRAPEDRDREFLVSTDAWFRPVQIKTGPDGALYVVDMYRQVIEHPRWISAERRAGLDVRAGSDRGRIYRIVPRDKSLRPVEKLASLNSQTLARRIENGNGIVRDQVQRLLVERGDRSAVPVLAAIARSGELAVSRMQAICTLDGLGALEADVVVAATRDPHPGVRRHAARLCETMIATDHKIGAALVKLADDPDPGVRFQTALALGALRDRSAGEALAKIAGRDAADVWIRAAVLSSAVGRVRPLLEKTLVLVDDHLRENWTRALAATAAGEHDVASLKYLFDYMTSKWNDAAPSRDLMTNVASICEVVSERGLGDVVETLAASPGVKRVFAAARRIAVNEAADRTIRIAAIALLGRISADRQADRAILVDLLEPARSIETRSPAIQSLARMKELKHVYQIWSRIGPATRIETIDLALSRRDSTAELVAVIERGEVSPAEIDAPRRRAFADRADPELKPRIEAFFHTSASTDRAPIVQRYLDEMKRLEATREAKPTRRSQRVDDRGMHVFERVCASCHRLGVIGHDVGPDLAALTDRSTEAFVAAILDPNREVDARYAAYTAALRDGRVFTGLVVAETADTIQLKTQDGKLEAILRGDLEELKGSGKSLMPEGLERDLKPIDLIDLIAYLNLAKTPAPVKSIPGNEPALVVAQADGWIRLDARSAAIRGQTLTYESEFGNLGFWRSPDDSAEWTFRVDRRGTYQISIEWACPNESAGDAFELACDAKSFKMRVDGTAERVWSNYRTIFVGEITLEPGERKLIVKPAGPIRDALFDLKRVVLAPR